MQDTLNHKTSKLRALVAEYYRLASETFQNLPDTDVERGTQSAQGSNFYNGFSIQRIWYDKSVDVTRARITALFADFLVVVVFQVDLWLSLCYSMHHSFWHIIFAQLQL